MNVNRRNFLSMLGTSPAVLAGVAAEARPTRAQSKAERGGVQGSGKIEALNPKGTPPPVQLIPMAPRLNSLDGKTVYLVDTGFAGGATLLNEMQQWFKRNMPSVNVVFKRKAGPYAEDDPALWKEIKEKGNAAIMATGH